MGVVVFYPCYMKYQDWSSIVSSVVLVAQLLVFGISHSSSKVANVSNITPTRHLGGDSPTSVEVSFRLLSGEEVISKKFEKPITPRKFYSELQKVEGYEWTNDQIFQLANGTEPLNPLSDGEITLENDKVINLIFTILGQYLKNDNIKSFINHEHRDSKFEGNSSLYADYFVMHFAVRKNGHVLQYAPDDLKTPEICLAAVQQDGWSIEFIPGNKKTPELCLAAVRQNGYSIREIPDELKTLGVCLAAAKQYGESIRYIPNNKKTPNVCLAAIQQDRRSIRLIPDDLKTPEICLAAVNQDGRSIIYVPDEQKTKEVCVAAIENGFFNLLKEIPVNDYRLETCFKVFKKHGLSMNNYVHLVPERVRSQFKELVGFDNEGEADTHHHENI